MKNFFVRVDGKDNVFTIAKKYNANVFEIISDNELVKDVEEGEIVYVKNQGQSIRYFVKPEDTLFSIAKKHRVTEEYIKNKNGNIPYVFYGMIIYL